MKKKKTGKNSGKMEHSGYTFEEEKKKNIFRIFNMICDIIILLFRTHCIVIGSKKKQISPKQLFYVFQA